jgi:sulfur-carrier protein
MKIELRVFATYRKPVGELLQQNTDEAVYLELPDGSTLGDLIERIGLKDEKVIIPLVNGLRQDKTWILLGGDRVGLFPPVGGG